MTVQRTYRASGHCQFDRACHAASCGSERSIIRSPEFPTLDQLDQWLARLTPVTRRCPSCHRPIALKHFHRRYWDSWDLYSFPVEDERHTLGYWPEGLEVQT